MFFKHFKRLGKIGSQIVLPDLTYNKMYALLSLWFQVIAPPLHLHSLHINTHIQVTFGDVGRKRVRKKAATVHKRYLYHAPYQKALIFTVFTTPTGNKYLYCYAYTYTALSLNNAHGDDDDDHDGGYDSWRGIC